MNDQLPAAGFPVCEYIEDELEARDWDLYDLAKAMGGDFSFTHASLEFLMLGDPDIVLDAETAERIGRAFGTSGQIWLNLNAAHRAFCARGECI